MRDSRDVDATGARTGSGTIIDQIINLSASNGDVNIVSAPHILTSDNEQAEIRVGDNIPIISSRVEQATGAANLSTSVNVERQDIGVTLRVTPQITEGDSLRMEIFQEITEINSNLAVGNVNDVGVALSNRRIENTVVVRDGETVVIGGLLSDVLDESVTKVPWLGDVPFLGWAFKSTNEQIRKTNLLVFLTPRIVRTPPRSRTRHDPPPRGVPRAFGPRPHAQRRRARRRGPADRAGPRAGRPLRARLPRPTGPGTPGQAPGALPERPDEGHRADSRRGGGG